MNEVMVDNESEKQVLTPVIGKSNIIFTSKYYLYGTQNRYRFFHVLAERMLFCAQVICQF